MTIFLRLLAEKDKGGGLLDVCAASRNNINDARIFHVAPAEFRRVPGAPFSYWVSDAVRALFTKFENFERAGRFVKHGLTTGNDQRFLRAWWECDGEAWLPFAKGGNYSPYYVDQKIVLKWRNDGAELRAGYETKSIPGTRLDGSQYFGKIGLTWPLRARRFSPHALPLGCSYSARGYCAFVPGGTELHSLALCNSRAFDYIFKVALGRFGFPEFIVGTLQILPWPDISPSESIRLSTLARRAWSLKRDLDTVEETSHAFLLPRAMRARLGDFDPPAIQAELVEIQFEIDELAFDLYGFSEADRASAYADGAGAIEDDAEAEEPAGEDVEEDAAEEIDEADGLLSWAVGVAFGRFDWRLATGERATPIEPEPFDLLPDRSPGMLQEDAEPFHRHAGVLADDRGHAHDLPHLVEEVLARTEASIAKDVRRWIRRDFFPLHLQQYSRSGRKAPIYWPLSTASGTYTLWLYHPSLTSQTLYTAVNDFLEPKLEQIGKQSVALRNKGNTRSRDEDQALEALQVAEAELAELRDTLLRIAPTYRVNHDDGVQITAAPLWPLFRYKPWQKLLKETWAKLEKGEYDWAHLAMAYWPERVREKCRTDKSLAIAHDLEHLYEPPETKAAKPRGRKKADGA